MPVGVFFPKTEDRLLLAEKAISVTNLVNGTSRLQPVSMQIGQVAGTLAAMAVREKRLPKDLSVRAVQRQLLSTGNYLLPYLDVPKTDARFAIYQRIGVTSILHGIGKHKDWKNETWLETDSILKRADLQPLADFYCLDETFQGSNPVSVEEAVAFIDKVQLLASRRLNNSSGKVQTVEKIRSTFGIPREGAIKRGDYAVLVDQLLHPFDAKDVDLLGNWK